MGVGVNVLRPHSLLMSLLLCHKINTLGATLVRVNINTPAASLGVSPGSAACGGGKDRDYSSTMTDAPTWHQRVQETHSPGHMHILCEGLMAANRLFYGIPWRFTDRIHLIKLWVVEYLKVYICFRLKFSASKFSYIICLISYNYNSEAA